MIHEEVLQYMIDDVCILFGNISVSTMRDNGWVKCIYTEENNINNKAEISYKLTDNGVDFKGIFFSKTKPSDVSEDGEISFLIYQSTDERYMYELILYLRGLHQAFGVNAINDKEFSYED